MGFGENKKEIYERIKKLSTFTTQDISLSESGFYFRRDFYPCGDEEPHDVAWDLYCDLQQELREVGLTLNAELEHDCISGEIGLLDE